MRTCIQTATILLLGAAGLGCGGPRSTVETGLARFAGIYRFDERVSTDLHLEGRFLVQPDTIELEMNTMQCRPEPLESRMEMLTYSCGPDVRLRFDRRQPVERVGYSAKVMVTETRTVCARFVTNRAGQQVCGEYRRESYQRVATRNGRLRPVRVQNAEWGGAFSER